MIEIGKFNTLKVIKRTEHGFYLKGDENWGNILLPNKYIPKGLSIDDEIRVFLYLDSSDTIIATTLKPLAEVGDFATLKVSSVEELGVFLEWGLEKNLFVPFREQIYKMVPGQSYPVYVYIDSSERIAASTRLKPFFSKAPPPFAEGDEVELLLYQHTDLGINAVVNGSHSGLIYKEDLINNLNLGEKVNGFVKKIRPDGKIDLCLRLVAPESRNELVDLILTKLKDAGGFININAKSSADVINAEFGVSRKKFKMALGYLYKKKKISTDETGTRLVK